MKHSRLRKALATLGISVAAIVMSFVVASPAFAYDFSMQTDDTDPGARLWWTANGDVVKICDQEADGWAAWARVADGSGWYEFSVGGNGKCASHDASDGGKYDLDESDKANLSICLVKSGESPQFCDYHYASQ